MADDRPPAARDALPSLVLLACERTTDVALEVAATVQAVDLSPEELRRCLRRLEAVLMAVRTTYTTELEVR